MGILSILLEDKLRKDRIRDAGEAYRGLLGTAPQMPEIPQGGISPEEFIGSNQYLPQGGTGYLGSDRGVDAQMAFRQGMVNAGMNAPNINSIMSPVDQSNMEQAGNQRYMLGEQIKSQRQKHDNSVKQGNVLRKERGQELKPFIEAKTQYNTTMNALQQDSGAGALASIFSFMKTLDPRSVVREGEQQMAKSTGGVTDTLVGMINQLKGKSSLGPTARKGMAEAIQAIMEGRVADAEAIAAQFDIIAEEQGVPLSQIRTGAYNPELQGVPAPMSFDKWKESKGY